MKVRLARQKNCHKGENGRLLIVAGSNVYTGSPVFNAMAALKSGIDIVKIITLRRPAEIAASFKPDIITIPVKKYDNKALKIILEESKRHDALLIGGGLERSKGCYRFIRKVIASVDIPMIIDAEAIRALGYYYNVLEGKEFVLTPHANEFLAFTGEEGNFVSVREWAEKVKGVILLKGSQDLISDGTKVVANKTGNPYMAKGGFGDVLAGICAGLVSRKVGLFESACLAAYVNGKAGDLLFNDKGPGMIASEIFDYIPKVLIRKKE
ncbi:NAD(P)H-hydrate dehydratase [Candidatus Woesearchaeota archaeon]|nr:MAG: NAD(P)H-hydrate dehydratase [Candidatus Woesearchaeota archaeon]